MLFFEDIEIGHRRDIGTYHFSAESIKNFAANSIRSASTSTRRRARIRCSAGSQPPAGMSARPA